MRLRIHSTSLVVRTRADGKPLHGMWQIDEARHELISALDCVYHHYGSKTIEKMADKAFGYFVKNTMVNETLTAKALKMPSLRQYMKMMNTFASFDYTYNKKKGEFINTVCDET